MSTLLAFISPFLSKSNRPKTLVLVVQINFNGEQPNSKVLEIMYQNPVVVVIGESVSDRELNSLRFYIEVAIRWQEPSSSPSPSVSSPSLFRGGLLMEYSVKVFVT